MVYTILSNKENEKEQIIAIYTETQNGQGEFLIPSGIKKEVIISKTNEKIDATNYDVIMQQVDVKNV